MKRILIIDDDNLTGTPPEAVRAFSSEQAINRFVERSVWDEVWFDHDLGGADTSMRVVEYLEKQRDREHPIFIGCVFVHSMNPRGAEELTKALSHMYPTRRVPLPWTRSARTSPEGSHAT